MNANLTCEYCGVHVFVADQHQLVWFKEREPEGASPRSFVIVGGDSLLHQCAFGLETLGG